MSLKFALPVVLLLAFATVPGAVPAPPTPHTVALAAGNNWAAEVWSAAVDCTSASLSVTWGPGHPALFGLVYLFGGTGVFNYAAYWEEGNNFYVTAEAFGGAPVTVGVLPTTPSPSSTRTVDLSAVLCSGTWTYNRVAVIAPGATSATLTLSLAAAPTVTASLGGANAFGSFGRNFDTVPGIGVKVDVGTYGLGGLNPAANAVFLASVEHNVGAGMLGVFLPLRLQYAGLNVQGPNGVLADADCVGYLISATCFSYGYVGGLGFGNATRAPAGDYEFTIRYQAGPEHHRIAAVGAPVNWCGVGPACPNLGY